MKLIKILLTIFILFFSAGQVVLAQDGFITPKGQAVPPPENTSGEFFKARVGTKECGVSNCPEQQNKKYYFFIYNQA